MEPITIHCQIFEKTCPPETVVSQSITNKNGINSISEPELDIYLKSATSLHSRISFSGFATRLRVPIQLDNLYVPLHALVDKRVTGSSDFGSSEEATGSIRETVEIALAEAFSYAKKLALEMELLSWVILAPEKLPF